MSCNGYAGSPSHCASSTVASSWSVSCWYSRMACTRLNSRVQTNFGWLKPIRIRSFFKGLNSQETNPQHPGLYLLSRPSEQRSSLRQLEVRISRLTSIGRFSKCASGTPVVCGRWQATTPKDVTTSRPCWQSLCYYFPRLFTDSRHSFAVLGGAMNPN